jgi:hypothetical protein
MDVARCAFLIFLFAGCGSSEIAAPQPSVNLDALGCSSGQSLEAETSPCTVDFGDCGYVIACDPVANGTRRCDCVISGERRKQISAEPAVCGSGSARAIANMSRTKKLPNELTHAAEACGWSYRCCACRIRPGNPLYGVDVCE